MKRFAAASAALLLCLTAAAKDVYIIHYGWMQPSLDDLRVHVAEMEEEAPFDGLVLQMGVTDVMGQNDIRYGDAPKDFVKRYRMVKFKRYAHNFALVMADQSRPDWFDDRYWKRVARNFATAADVVAKAGMEGLCFDPEGYGVYPVTSYWTSKWFLDREAKPEWKGEKHTREQYLEAARQRGREVGAAMFAKAPKMRFWGLYLYSFGADLMGEFCNGLLDVMPKTAALVDGDEWRGYCSTGESAYENLAARKKSGCGMLDKKHQAPYRRLGQLAVAFYMDFYADAKSPIFEGRPDAFREAGRTFKENLRSAKRVAGDYVWVYGESGQWWDFEKYKGKNKYPMWDDKVKGARAALFAGRLPPPGKSAKGAKGAKPDKTPAGRGKK